MSVKEKFISFIHQLQDDICAALEKIDGKATFREDRWERPGGGGGKTRVIVDGNVFEKGGVNTSVVEGELPEVMAKQFGVTGGQFMACGISLVIHPLNPYVPTVHANWRYFELYDAQGNIKDSWFGGGADLTPYYMDEEDGKHFHRTFKNACDPFGAALYPLYKKQCDEYFVNKHRNNETRGIGGIFYDYLRPDAGRTAEDLYRFSKATGEAFIPAYLPIVEKTKDLPYTTANKDWQEYRRGRYVEFNLIHDRGTLFGLKTNGRIESILMSLPPRARWEYDYHPEPGSAEARMVEYLQPREWA
ncbi:MAG: Coproporphyrinogen oxidase [Bacteroidetes bacterium]|uniref:oxygen-dependent coproporphyrinogen oxidase n=1 Tax=unclassified Chitinophaga TaxID=2619133 RepID=UPI0009C6C647|nr:MULTISPECIES: oxygen-dependent coproporphyrinogen oxidase [unclassified Chitinophaga]MBP1651419.1 Coproporphyrinogen oxidase [Bacteroidota bacterium]OMP80226.1 coproporphyrinogen III oxidase [[Flexibacter] sp. ATCC 35208]WPV66785.1 oxygen-dependent coproporphyrinogen oxidase [Chitinophaga sp. LS1]